MNQEASPEDTRGRILQAAMQLFSQQGYVKASTRSIAAAAGVNEVTLFRHFGSKKNLLQACLETFNAGSFTARFEQALTGSYPADIRRMADLQIEDTHQNFELLRMMICDARHVPELRAALLAGGRGNLARLSAYFRQQAADGAVRADLPPDVLAAAFDSLFSSYILYSHLFDGSLAPQLPDDAVIQAMVELFVRGTQP